MSRRLSCLWAVLMALAHLDVGVGVDRRGGVVVPVLELERVEHLAGVDLELGVLVGGGPRDSIHDYPPSPENTAQETGSCSGSGPTRNRR